MRKLIILLMFLSFSVFAEPVNINKENDKEAGSPYFCESSFWASKPKFAAKA